MSVTRDRNNNVVVVLATGKAVVGPPQLQVAAIHPAHETLVHGKRNLEDGNRRQCGSPGRVGVKHGVVAGIDTPDNRHSSVIETVDTLTVGMTRRMTMSKCNNCSYYINTRVIR